jgi:hypothetical protein
MFDNDIAYLKAEKLEAGLAHARQKHEAREEHADTAAFPPRGRGVSTRPPIGSPLHKQMSSSGSRPMETQYRTASEAQV